MVPNNTILVLGGLISDDVRETEEAVPGLSKIPGLGRLFRYNSTDVVKRSLMIFIRPTILTDNSIMEDISSSKYNYLRARQLEFRDNPRGLTPTDQMPLLPELYEYLQTPAPAAPPGREN
jgi:general secretion pathway protein D